MPSLIYPDKGRFLEIIFSGTIHIASRASSSSSPHISAIASVSIGERRSKQDIAPLESTRETSYFLTRSRFALSDDKRRIRLGPLELRKGLNVRPIATPFSVAAFAST